MRFGWFALVGILVAGSAGAAPLVRNGSAVRVVLPAGRQAARAIKPAAAGWTVRLGVASGTVNLVDVTDGAAATKYLFNLDGVSTDIVLDTERFIAGHAYRIELRDGKGGVQSSFVYLVAPKSGNSANVAFSGADDCLHDEEDGIRIRDKGRL